MGGFTFIDGAPLHCPDLEAYWRDPRAADAERAANRTRFARSMAGHDARVRAEQEARWAREERS